MSEKYDFANGGIDGEYSRDRTYRPRWTYGPSWGSSETSITWHKPENVQALKNREGRIIIEQIAFPLFLPATRMDRLDKACTSGADAVIIDLEDAIDVSNKHAAREALIASLKPALVPLLVRINGLGTAWCEADLGACRDLPLDAVMLPKAEAAADCDVVIRATGKPVVALIESARGLANAGEIAAASARMAFGSIDYAADLGLGHLEHALLHARSVLVHTARLERQAAPFDGVTEDLHDAAWIAAESRRSSEMGFGGKLLIHPAQIEPARRGFAPTTEEVDWARRVLAATRAGGSAVQLDGAMLDAPVIKRAESILKRSAES